MSFETNASVSIYNTVFPVMELNINSTIVDPLLCARHYATTFGGHKVKREQGTYFQRTLTFDQ